MTPEFGGTLTRIPLELLAVCLYRRRPFDRLCISLPGDAGEYDLEQALELMTPYLPAGGACREGKPDGGKAGDLPL